MKPLVRLWDSVGLDLIIEYPSGILYSNQTGGTSCLHPEIEGVYIPLRNRTEASGRKLISPEHELFEYFAGPKHNCTGATTGLDPEDADYVDSVMSRNWLVHIVSVDRNRLPASHEAWVHVLVHGEGQSNIRIFRGLGPYPRPGILTWSNTD